MQTISAFPRQKGIKYKCRKGPQAELIEARRLEGQRVFLSSEANH